jgi:hypothetical protein
LRTVMLAAGEILLVPTSSRRSCGCLVRRLVDEKFEIPVRDAKGR